MFKVARQHIVRIIALLLLVAGLVILTIVAYSNWSNGQSFWANFFLNFISEFGAVALPALGIGMIAWWITKKKLEKAIGLIARLRTKGTIDCNTARAAVAGTVLIISPDFLRHARSSESNGQPPKNCGVCGLEVKTEPGPPEQCEFCGLPDKFWKLPFAAQ